MSDALLGSVAIKCPSRAHCPGKEANKKPGITVWGDNTIEVML